MVGLPGGVGGIDLHPANRINLEGGAFCRCARRCVIVSWHIVRPAETPALWYWLTRAGPEHYIGLDPAGGPGLALDLDRLDGVGVLGFQGPGGIHTLSISRPVL